jgi:uncharacterized protein YoxC
MFPSEEETLIKTISKTKDGWESTIKELEGQLTVMKAESEAAQQAVRDLDKIKQSLSVQDKPLLPAISDLIDSAKRMNTAEEQSANASRDIQSLQE